MADDPVALPADTSIRTCGPGSMNNLGIELVRANAPGSIALPADMSLRPAGTGTTTRNGSTNVLRTATLPRDTKTNAVVLTPRLALEPKR